MDNFKFTKVSENLVKAQKHLTKLRDSIKVPQTENTGWGRTKSQYQPQSSLVINKFLSICTTEEDLFLQINENIFQIRSEFFSRLQLKQDLNNLKLTVYRKNTEIGLDKILSKMDYLMEMKNLYQNMLLQLKKDNFYNLDKMSSIFKNYNRKIENESNNSVSENISVRVYEIEELHKNIKEICKNIEQLENERDKLNATTFIDIELSSVALETLGIDL
ncbi:Hypothetical protein KVN_LOCUS97 [uncultured virus]|nr:Hypothetical protein KVN_LOCUS97 [uncultured virus]